MTVTGDTIGRGPHRTPSIKASIVLLPDGSMIEKVPPEVGVGIGIPIHLEGLMYTKPSITLALKRDRDDRKDQEGGFAAF